jgi:hypothetical protein
LPRGSHRRFTSSSCYWNKTGDKTFLLRFM